MPKEQFGQDQVFATVLEALVQNSENLQKTLETLTSLMDSVDSKYEANTNKIIERLSALQSDLQTLQTQIKKTELAPMPIPPPPSALNTAQKPPTLWFRNWVEFQILAAQAQMSAYTVREVDSRFEVDAVKNDQVLVFVGQIPKVDSMLKSWLSSQLGVIQEKVVEGTIQI